MSPRAPTPPSWLASVRSRLCEQGIDIVHAFNAEAYDRDIRETTLRPLTPAGCPPATALLLGNTRAIWVPFLSAMDRSPRLTTHPLEDFVENAIRMSLLQSHAPPHHIRWGHDMGPDCVSMLRAGRTSELAHATPCHMVIHPVFGLWFALRAVVVFEQAFSWAGPPATKSPCAGCPQPCVAAMQQAIAAGSTTGSTIDGTAVRNHWTKWLAVRDACPVGRNARYGDEQIRYHYAQDRSALGPQTNTNAKVPKGTQ